LSGAGNPGPEPIALPAPAPGVALWWCALERSPEAIEALALWLSEAELARAARFGTAALRARYVAGRAMLRQLLGARLALPPSRVPIRRGLRGRPELDLPGAPDFNVSNTAGMALIAIAERPRVGVDVEHRERRAAADKLARKFLTATEAAALAHLQPDERRRAFLRHWTCKEAMSKATGDGLAAPFGRIEVEIAPGPRVVGGPAPYGPGDWELHYAAVPADYYATIALWRARADA
jgi:4'-phosphopantetheinyl transferase